MERFTLLFYSNVTVRMIIKQGYVNNNALHATHTSRPNELLLFLRPKYFMHFKIYTPSIIFLNDKLIIYETINVFLRAAFRRINYSILRFISDSS